MSVSQSVSLSLDPAMRSMFFANHRNVFPLSDCNIVNEVLHSLNLRQENFEKAYKIQLLRTVTVVRHARAGALVV